MISPSPSQIQGLADEISHALARVNEEAAWLHGIAYERHVGDSVKVRSHAADPTRDLATPDHGGHNRTEPACRGCQREVLAGTRVRLLMMLKQLNALEASIKHAMGENRGKMADAQRMVRDGPWPRVVTKGELAAYEAAHERRKSRQENVP